MRELLDLPHLTITSRRLDHELARLHAVVEHKVLVDGRVELEETFGALLAARTEPPMPKTLDFVGHATPASLLDLGGWVIDRCNPTVTAFFRELADHDVLPRLGISSVRLLGCGTASTQRARDTIIALTDIVGLPVLGTTSLVHAGHFRHDGFDPQWAFLLVGARELSPPPPLPEAPPARAFDVDALAALPLVVNDTPWRRFYADTDEARQLLALIRRTDGAEMPGLLATPLCEIAIRSARAGLFHVVQVMFEGQFVRVYPPSGPGLLYPVRDPAALLACLDGLASTI
ncbi:MAG: hypothetical protein AB7T06_02210 [Kofleriaceae bacterium]